jgi:hypothetical protein
MLLTRAPTVNPYTGGSGVIGGKVLEMLGRVAVVGDDEMELESTDSKTFPVANL